MHIADQVCARTLRRRGVDPPPAQIPNFVLTELGGACCASSTVPHLHLSTQFTTVLLDMLLYKALLPAQERALKQFMNTKEGHAGSVRHSNGVRRATANDTGERETR